IRVFHVTGVQTCALPISLIAKDQLAMGNSTKVHSSYLVADFNKYLADLKGTGAGAEVLSGQEIYEVRCASCHRFDQKLVGPPYKIGRASCRERVYIEVAA